MRPRVCIMAGGAGTRLKPLSSTEEGKLPKQFLPLTGPMTLFQQTVGRMPAYCDLLVIPERRYSREVIRQAEAIGVSSVEVLDEPYGCNTAPAVTAAAAWTAVKHRSPDQVICMVPADHVMDEKVFQKLFSRAVEAAEKQNCIITIGITPDRPETGYGYIKAEGSGDLIPVDAFVEKPDVQRAQEYYASGSYFWNSGMFFGKAGLFVELAETFCPEIAGPIVEGFQSGEQNVDRAYRAIKEGGFGRSIDYAVMEKIPHRILLVPAPQELRWNDLGSWESLGSCLLPDKQGNRMITSASADTQECRGTMVFNYTSIPVVMEGVSDMVLVVTEDGILLRRRKG